MTTEGRGGHSAGAPWADDVIGRTVQVLDLRNTRTYMVDSRRNVMAASSAKKASPRSEFGSALPASPRRHAERPGPTATLGMGSPTQTAAAISYFQQLETDRNELEAKVAALEGSLRSLVGMFESHVSAVEATVGPASQFYTVTFGSGAIGMLVTGTDTEHKEIRVADLKDDPETGEPLLAKKCGRVFVGDTVIAVNGNYLNRYGTPTPEQIASEFRNARRPMSILFKRNPETRLAAVALDDIGAART